jgi:hypothetical protein
VRAEPTMNSGARAGGSGECCGSADDGGDEVTG